MSKPVMHQDVGYAGSSVYYIPKTPPLNGPLARRRARRKRCNRRCCCLSCLCMIVVLIAIIGVGALAFWLVVHPESPHYSISNIRITGLDPSSLNSSQNNGTVSTQTSFTFGARNPNKKIGIYYDKVNVNIEVLGVVIGKGNVDAPFYQGHRNTTFISGNLTSGPLSTKELSQAGILGASKAGKVPLDFTVDVKARVKIGSWKYPKLKFHVKCSSVVNPKDNKGSGTQDGSCSSKIKP